MPANGSAPAPLLEVRRLKKYFPIRKGVLRRVVGQVRAVDDVSFSLAEGETLGLVGESGCGKTTTARCILRALDPSDGQVLFRREAGERADDGGCPGHGSRPKSLIAPRDRRQSRRSKKLPWMKKAAPIGARRRCPRRRSLDGPRREPRRIGTASPHRRR